MSESDTEPGFQSRRRVVCFWLLGSGLTVLILGTTFLLFIGGEKKAMELEVYLPPKCEPSLISSAPTPVRIHELVHSLRWDPITFVVLRKDEKNWFEVSGSADPTDGFSARVMVAGKETVTHNPPKSIDEMVRLLESYLADDDRWRIAMGFPPSGAENR